MSTIKTTNLKCPAGHDVAEDENGLPTCMGGDCEYACVGYNGGKVYEWMDAEEHYENVRAMNDAMDAAFDNTYFGDF